MLYTPSIKYWESKRGRGLRIGLGTQKLTFCKEGRDTMVGTFKLSYQ